jgi:Flp pilus assembly protein TadG
VSLPARLRHDSRGAVLAEFCIVIVPLLTMFFSFVQLSRIAAARLMVKHSAIVGARAAAVMSNGADNNPGERSGSNDAAVETAVKSALGPWWNKSGGVTAATVDVNDTSSKDDPYNWVEVKVTATYACNVPMGSLICGGKTKQLVERFRMPHQGAQYESED